jgi:ABC-type phosphate transport system permease subunit
MNVWEFIGWLIAVPLGLMTALFVYAVSVAVVRAIARGTKK